MKKNAAKLLIVLTVAWMSPLALNSQNFDYHREESMAISWNGVGLTDARNLATGGVSLLTSRAFAALYNPALIFGKNGIQAGLGLELMSFEAYQFWGVNQGVLKAPDGLRDTDLRLSGFSLTMPIGRIALSYGWFVEGLLEYPDFDQDDRYWGFSGLFSGRSDHYFLAAACQPLKKLQLGIKLTYSAGRRSVDLVEHFYFEGGYFSLIEQLEVHKSRSMIGTLGLVYRISPRFTAGMDFDYQLSGIAERSVTRKFESNFPFPSIVDQQSSRDDFFVPPRLRVGASLDALNPDRAGSGRCLVIGIDLMAVWWSAYQYQVFGENQNRDMRNTVVFALGTEYGVLNDSFDYFFRLGYRLDPQPVRDPLVSLHALTGGMGITFNRFSIDLGMAFYTGSATGIVQNHLVVSGTLSFKTKGE